MGARIITTAWLTPGLKVPLGKIDHLTAEEDNCITLVGGAVIWGPPKDFVARAAAAASMSEALYALAQAQIFADQAEENAVTRSQHHRETDSVTTGILAPNATENTTIALYRATELLSIATNYPAWVRVYSTNAARIADSLRPITTDAVAGTGLQAEVITTTSLLFIPTSPSPVLCNLDDPATDVLYLAIRNLDSVSRAVTVQFTHLKLED